MCSTCISSGESAHQGSALKSRLQNAAYVGSSGTAFAHGNCPVTITKRVTPSAQMSCALFAISCDVCMNNDEVEDAFYFYDNEKNEEEIL